MRVFRAAALLGVAAISTDITLPGSILILPDSVLGLSNRTVYAQ